VQAIKRAYRLGQDRKVIINCIVNKDIILEAILSNKTILYKFITSIIQLLTANNE
jgi:SNF2 family DNA or RNA helicase